MTNPGTNPFQQAPAQAQQPMISDQAAQQFAPQQAPNAFAQPAQDYAAMTAQGQHPVQQAYAQQQPAQAPQSVADTAAQQFAQGQQFAPSLGLPQQQFPGGAQQNVPGAPWTPAQHQQSVPQAYAPPVQQPPAQAQPGLPQQQFPGGFPGGAPAQQPGGGFDPSLFGAPSAGGGGNYPKVRDLNGRLCLFRVKRRDLEGTAYKSTEKTTNYVANVAVLDGGPLYSSPDVDAPLAQPVLVSETIPYVIADLTIGQKGMQNRLKNDMVRGRVVRMPMGQFEAGLKEQFPGMEGWQALWTWLSQNPSNVDKLPNGGYFWGIVEDLSPEADQMVHAFAQHPAARELML